MLAGILNIEDLALIGVGIVGTVFMCVVADRMLKSEAPKPVSVQSDVPPTIDSGDPVVSSGMSQELNMEC